MRDWRWWLAQLWLWVLLASGAGRPVMAQIGAGALAGSVLDQAGATVPGATITVVDIGDEPSSNRRNRV